jgi:translation initiation factor 6 (eIF-6)
MIVAGQAGECDPAGAAAGGDLLQAVGPIAPAAQQADEDEAGVRYDTLDIEVYRERVAELQEVGEAQARRMRVVP